MGGSKNIMGSCQQLEPRVLNWAARRAREGETASLQNPKTEKGFKTDKSPIGKF